MNPWVVWGWIRAVKRRSKLAGPAAVSMTGAALAPDQTLAVDQRPDLLAVTLAAEFERHFAQ